MKRNAKNFDELLDIKYGEIGTKKVIFRGLKMDNVTSIFQLFTEFSSLDLEDK